MSTLIMTIAICGVLAVAGLFIYALCCMAAPADAAEQARSDEEQAQWIAEWAERQR